MERHCGRIPRSPNRVQSGGSLPDGAAGGVAQPRGIQIRRAALLPFVFVMYAYTTGGPFGLEDQITLSGPGLTLLSLLLIPFLWCVPVSLAVAEMTTALPREGG